MTTTVCSAATVYFNRHVAVARPLCSRQQWRLSSDKLAKVVSRTSTVASIVNLIRPTAFRLITVRGVAQIEIVQRIYHLDVMKVNKKSLVEPVNCYEIFTQTVHNCLK